MWLNVGATVNATKPIKKDRATLNMESHNTTKKVALEKDK